MDNVIKFSRPVGLNKYQVIEIVKSLNICDTAKNVFIEMSKTHDIERLRKNYEYIKAKHKDKTYYEDVSDDELLSNNQSSYKGVF